MQRHEAVDVQLGLDGTGASPPGRSSGVIRLLWHRITARSMTFSSSRTLPGHWYCTRIFRASGVRRVLPRTFSWAYFLTK